MTNRLDHLEHSLRKDMRTILDILHQQQQQQALHFQQQQQQSVLGSSKVGQTLQPPIGSSETQQQQQLQQPQVKSSYQPSESEMSFEMATGGAGGSVLSGQASSSGQRNVHRSVSQPETANEKGLLR